MQKHISDAEREAASAPRLRFVIVTLDNHLAASVARATEALALEPANVEISLHAASEFASNPDSLDRCIADIGRGDIILVTMLFMDDHVKYVLPALMARRDQCDAMICCMSAGEIIKLSRMGRLDMGKPERGLMALMKRLRGARKSDKATAPSSGARQMAMLKRLPKILKFIPGSAQDLRAYFLTLQYWLAASDENVVNLVRFLADRYGRSRSNAAGARLAVAPPTEYPEVGIYHPRMPGRIGVDSARLPSGGAATSGTVGLLVMRSYLLAGNTAHYDGVIEALEARGLNVIPAFASGLDARPAVERFFKRQGTTCVDAVLSLTGFSLVGGPAYNDASAAADMLHGLDVPYLAAHAVEFQTIEQWSDGKAGLTPVEATMMIAIPELDGATGPMLFGGRSERPGAGDLRSMASHNERARRIAERVSRLVALRKSARKDRKLAIVLFNFPPNSGATGTAAFLSVFASLHNTLKALKAAGYAVDVPETVDELRDAILSGNARQYGSDANVMSRIDTDDHVAREAYLEEIEAQWGPAPGRHQTDGRGILILGKNFGNVCVTVQPAFGFEGDPMRLLFEGSFAPTHAFSAFYRYLREDFAADAVLHFGTHGALEFMPGKQTALSEKCWPDRLIGDLPNFYFYAANNPSEGTLAKRRSAATLLSYQTPPLSSAGLYRGLIDLKSAIERWRNLEPGMSLERDRLAELIQSLAAAVDLASAEPYWSGDEADARIASLGNEVRELEYTLIPNGLHVIGRTPTREERRSTLTILSESTEAGTPLAGNPDIIDGLIDGLEPRAAIKNAGLSVDDATVAALARLAEIDRHYSADSELPALVHALDGNFVRPAPSGDLVRNPNILPTGRNLHGFDPFRMPSAYAVRDGAEQAARLIARHVAETGNYPQSIAMVLWGTDNLKSEGGPIAQALALLGARPRFDNYGRLCGAELVPLSEIGRPRIDVLMTLSGIFRDLLPLQTKLLAEASFLAASADEPHDQNFVRRNALTHQARHGCDFETAALRVFSNADNAYGSNVNLMIESGHWQDESELAECYSKRKCFAYDRSGKAAPQAELLGSILTSIDLTYQNLESVELGVTTIDHYFDTLGGLTRAARRANGAEVPVYIGDQTRGTGKVRTLTEQVAIETRTRILNPRWYEGMLEHGYEGVRHIEANITNAMGWSATTGQVAPWVYQHLTETFVLDDAMRNRLAALNPTASAKLANRLIEAHERNYWTPDEATLEALRAAGEELEDRLEGIEPSMPPSGQPTQKCSEIAA